MSYTNPKQYIDNQSAQIQQNLQKNLAAITAKTTSDIGKIYAENSRLNKELIKQVDNKITKQTNAAIQTHKKNPSVKMDGIYKLAKYVADIKKSNPSSWSEKQRNTVSSWDSLATRMQNTFENTLSADPTKALSNLADKPGGIDTQRGSTKTRVMMAMSNLIDADKISQFPIDETGFINYNILVKANGKEIGNVINDTPESTMEIDLVPDIIKSIDEGNAKVAGIINAGNPLSPYYEEGEPVQYKDKKTGKVIMEGRKMNLEKVRNTWIETQKSNDYIGLDKSGQVSLYQTKYKDKNDPNYSYDNPTDDELKVMEKKYIDKEFNRFLAANPKILAALKNPKAPKQTSTKKLTEGDYKRLNYKDKVKYLDSRFTSENVTFESAFELANEEGIKVDQILEEITEEVIELKLGNTIINKNDPPEIIKKKLLIAGGVKNKDAEELINQQSQLFQPYTGNLPIKK